MRILVNDIAASKGGALTILNQVYSYAIQHPDDEWIFMLGSNYLDERSNVHIVCLPEIKNSHLKKLAFDFFIGKRIIEKYNPDVVLSLQNIITFGVSVPQFVYIHQSIPFQDVKKFSFLKSSERPYAKYQYIIGKIIKISARKANGIIVQTDWMKEAVSRKTNVNMDNIIVCFPDVEFMQFEKNCEYHSNNFFYPTSDAIYKNNTVIIEACEILNDRGIKDFKVYMTLPNGKIQHPNIECINYINREDVFQYYQTSNLLFPSYIETIGLPLVEAMSVDGVIIAAKCPYAENVLSGYSKSYLFDPFNAGQLAELMERVMLTKQHSNGKKYKRDQKSEWGKAFSFIKSKR